MKISDIQRLMGLQNYHKDAGPKAGGTGGRKSKQTDEVQISSEALRLQGTQDAERSKRVQDLKEQVSTGTYHVDANGIAEKLLPYIKD